MEYEWDEAKQVSNLWKHGIDISHAAEVFAGLSFTVVDDRRAYGEDRYQTTGYLEHELVMVIWTPRGGRRRIISVRRCNANERQGFEDRLGRSG